MIMLKVDSEYVRYILSMQTASISYTQPLNNGIYIPCEYSLSQTLLSRIYEIYLRKFGWIQCSSMYTKICGTNFGPFGEIDANFALQLSSRAQFAKINN